jgi:hypothetical protein
MTPGEPVGIDVEPAAVEFGGQFGAAEFVLDAVLQGDDTPPRAALFAVGEFEAEANGFDDDNRSPAAPIDCSAARMPASTPSRSEFPVCEIAFWLRSAIEGAVGWLYRSYTVDAGDDVFPDQPD